MTNLRLRIITIMTGAVGVAIALAPVVR